MIINHGVVPSHRSRAKPIPKSSATARALSMPWPSVSLALTRVVGKRFIGLDDRSPAGCRACERENKLPRIGRAGAIPSEVNIRGVTHPWLFARLRRTLGWSTVNSTIAMASIPKGRYVGFSPESTG